MIVREGAERTVTFITAARAFVTKRTARLDDVIVLMTSMGVPRICRAAACAIAVSALMPRISYGQTVDEIVSRHIAARGGLEKLEAVKTIRMTRTVATGIGSTLRVLVYKKRPNLMRLEQGLNQPGAALTPRGMNADAVWDMVQGKPTARPAQIAAEARELDGDFDGPLVGWKAKGHTVTLAGREAMPGGDVYKLNVTLKSGLTRAIYLDAKTYLDRRHAGVLNLPGGRQFDVTISFDNWRDIEGVKFPFDITEERTGKEPVTTLVTYTEKIELNVPMDDSLFAMPASAQR